MCDDIYNTLLCVFLPWHYMSENYLTKHCYCVCVKIVCWYSILLSH